VNTFKVGDEVTVESPAPHAGQIGTIREVDADHSITLFRVVGDAFDAWYWAEEISLRVLVSGSVVNR
jgi:hypothetical protein